MSETNARPYVKYLITAGICLLVAVGYFFSNIPVSELSATPMVEIAEVLSNSCAVPGLFTLMLGLLFWVSSQGALDGISYLGSFMMKVMIPGKRTSIEKYGDYVARKRSDRKSGGFGFLCVVGGVFVLLSLAFLGMFYMYY